MRMSLYRALQLVPKGVPQGRGGFSMEQAAIEAILPDGYATVRVRGQSRRAVPINDGELRPGDPAWISDTANGIAIIHGVRF